MSWIDRLFGRSRPAVPNKRFLVSSALKVKVTNVRGYNQRRTAESVQNVLSIIDQVHKDGKLPRIPLKIVFLTDVYGAFIGIENVRPVRIEIGSLGSHVEMTTAHEIGHFLDFSGIEVPNQVASRESPILEEWRQAIKNSIAVQNLGRMRCLATAPGIGFDASMVEYPVNTSYVEYLLSVQELWARSYAQFIASQSGDETLRSQMSLSRQPPLTGLHYWEQWEDEDFLPIMAAIAATFRQIGWL